MDKPKPPDYEDLLRQGEYLWEWKPNADRNAPHVRLPGSGLHSDGFFRSPADHPALTQTFSYQIRDLLIGAGISDQIDMIVGPALETSPLATLLTLRIQEHHPHADQRVRMGLTQRVNPGTPQEDQEWATECGTLHGREDGKPIRILVVEYAIATGDTAIKTIRTIHRYAKLVGKEVAILPFIGCIVNRLTTDELRNPEGTFKLIACFRKQFSRWEETECPLCQAGSIALDPRTQWAKLARTV